VRLKSQPNNEKKLSELVRAIETETERLSPLLLWSEKALRKLLKGKKEPCTVDELVYVAKTMGISRHILVNRLRMLHPTEPNGFRYSNGLRNVGIGLAEWNNWRTAVLRSWPLFSNFDRNIVPAFFFKLARQDVLAQDVWADESFAMCGGPKNAVEIVIDAGSPNTPDADKMKVRLSFEDCGRKAGTEFLYVVHKKA
jgi:hypothetical protein